MFKSFFLNKNNFLILIILILALFLRYYNFDKYGYWMDEYWGTFYLSNPELSFGELQNRIEDFGKFQFGMPEPTPIYYYYLLNIFFEILGYNPENGRIFSILFNFTSVIFFFFTCKLITTKFNSIISLVLISLIFGPKICATTSKALLSRVISKYLSDISIGEEIRRKAG